jgi:cerevisin
MASPHICGLLAYLLSIHGTETFDIAELAGARMVESDATVYAKAYSLLPPMLRAILPPPQSLKFVAPNHGDAKVTPAQLKKALLGLSSSGKLTDLPAGTPNLLAFNNATSEQTK